MLTFSFSKVILIGSMSLGQGFFYVQFHPLVYLFKLHIELNMADLIAKVVRSDQSGSYESHSASRSKGTAAAKSGIGVHNGVDPRGVRMATLVTSNREAKLPSDISDDDIIDINARPKGGIQRTIETEVRHEHEDDVASRASSTAGLQKKKMYTLEV